MAALADTDVVIVEAVRSPLGRRNGALASVHDHAGEGAALYVVRQNYGILLEVSPARVGSNEIT